jgi:signal peptidase I
VDRRAYWTAAPQRGDVGVARDRADRIGKRVVHLPGDDVELDSGRSDEGSFPTKRPETTTITGES